jgi:adenylosuccinate lyase
LNQLASAPSSFAKTLRLMAGHELASEGFAKGQVGSSAMPHKMNSRSCERINGFKVILGVTSRWPRASPEISGMKATSPAPWCAASCCPTPSSRSTAPRNLPHHPRPDGCEPAVIERENRHYLPFLLSTTIMMTAVKRGIGRETAHEVIKEHAVAAARAYRAGESDRNDLVAVSPPTAASA